MRAIKVLILLATAFILSTCKKYRYETSCAGVVIDFTTSEAIPGATVFLGRAVSNFSGTDYIEVDRTTTDSHGKFSFKVMAEKSGDYFVLAKGAEWYFDNELHERIEIEKGKKASKKQQSLQVMMKPLGVIKFHITRTDLTYDYLAITIKYNYQTSGMFSAALDTNFVLSNVDGNRELMLDRQVVKYKIDSSNNWNEIYNQVDIFKIYSKSKDTTYLTLNY